MRTWLIATSLLAGALALPASLGSAADRAGGHPARHSQAPWYQTAIRGNVMHFLHRDPPEIRRHDFAAGEWLDPVALSDTPTAFAAGQEEYYVAYGRAIHRVNATTGQEQHLRNTPEDAYQLHVDSSFVFSGYGTWMSAANKETGEILSDRRSPYRIPRQGVLLEDRRVIVGRTTGISPADMVRMFYEADGELTDPQFSPYHGTYPSGHWLVALPDGERVVDSGGSIYDVDSFRYAGGLGGGFNDVTFADGNFVVRRGNRLDLIAENTAPLGFLAPEEAVLAMAGVNGTVVLYHPEGNGAKAVAVALEDFAPLETPEPVDATRLAYAPGDVLLADGVVHLMDASRRQVHRWSVEERAYLPPLLLTGTPHAPSGITYSAENGSLYVLYGDGRITAFPAAGTGEHFLARLPTPVVHGVLAAGEYIVGVDSTGAWYSHHVLNHEGVVLDAREWNRRSRAYIWSAVNRRMYHFRDGTSPNNVHWQEILEDGSIGEHGDTPEHSGVDVSLPLSVSPDGTLILTGGGYLRDGITIERVDFLPHSVDAATWRGDAELTTARNHGGGTQVQTWTSSWGPAETVILPGTPVDLFWTGEQFLVITLNAGFPQFHLLDGELDLEFQSTIPTTLWHLY